MLCYAKSLQSCPTLCVPIDGSLPGSPVPGILQARTLEWLAISFSNAWKWKVKVKSLSRVRLLATPWTAATRLLHPWDLPGQSTGVGCHCLLQETISGKDKNHKLLFRLLNYFSQYLVDTIHKGFLILVLLTFGTTLVFTLPAQSLSIAAPQSIFMKKN